MTPGGLSEPTATKARSSRRESSPIRVAILNLIQSADLAHLVERHLAKVEVAGSSPVIRSIFGAIAKR